MFKKFVLIVLSLAAASNVWAGASEGQNASPAKVWSVDGSFADIKQTLSDTITGRGMVISYVSHASGMLSRTAKAVGATEQVYGDAEILLFCKADLSHKLVAANPENIVLCPYTIAIYTLHGKPETVYLATPKPYTAEPAFAPVTQMLEEIITEVVDW